MRPEMQRLLKDIKSRKLDKLIAIKVDILTRNNYEPKKYEGSVFEKYNNELIDINDKLESILSIPNKYGYLEERKIKYCIEHLDNIMDDIKINLSIH